jgi:hypothetical protein
MKKKKNKKSGKKRAASKSRVSAKAKLSARSGPKKGATKHKRPARRRRVRENEDVLGNQGIQKVPLSAIRPKARSARVGGGAGDYRGVSVVEGADSESPKELLEEGQTFESGVVSGVQNAPSADQGEVRTREVPMDDVPLEYDDQDRP